MGLDLGSFLARCVFAGTSFIDLVFVRGGFFAVVLVSALGVDDSLADGFALVLFPFVGAFVWVPDLLEGDSSLGGGGGTS